jgi:hypothetical protein
MKNKLIVAFVILVVILSSCSLPRFGGVVQGAVYADLNGNGTIEEPAEGPLAGVEVTLADCGPTQTQVTGADGMFHFANLPEGTCHVSVAKAGWIYSGEYPLLSYPMPAASDPSLPTSFSMFMAPVMDFIPTDTPTTVPGEPAGDTPTTVPSSTPTLVPGTGPAMVTPNTEDVNCRFSISTAFLSVGALRVGDTVPILGRLADNSWWQIDNPLAIGTRCWVAASVTTATGDIASVPVVAAPVSGLVTAVSVTAPSVIHGYCHGPNPINFQVSITTNGPATVMAHVEIYNGDGTFRNGTSDEAHVFTSASTQTFDPGGAYKTDCGDYYIIAVVTSPNSMTSAETHWSVVEP